MMHPVRRRSRGGDGAAGPQRCRTVAAAAAFLLAIGLAPFGHGFSASAEVAAGTGDDPEWTGERPRPSCARLLPAATIAFAGLYPAIEEKIALSSFRPGQVVEIDPKTMSADEAVSYVRELKSLGARVSIYIVGGHCEIGADCERLGEGVRLGPTGSWNWDRSERRILDITHPAVLARLAPEIENGWRLGANYIRIDNLHHPAGSTHPRTPAQLNVLIDLAHDVEDRLRASGAIEPARVTGLVAHNNLVGWARLIEEGRLRRPPALLTSERTAQLAAFPPYEGDARMKAGRLTPDDVPDIRAGRRLAQHFQVPYSIAEFRTAHDLARPGASYAPPRAYAEAASRLSGVTEVIVIENESNYVGRGEVLAGPGPRVLPQRPDPSAPALTGRPCSLLPLDG